MIIGFTSAIIDLKAVYTTHKGYGAKNDYWAVDEVLKHPAVGVWGVRMRKIDLTLWETTDETYEFSKDYFFGGSGFGGLPYLEADFFLRIENNVIYRGLE